MRAFKTRLQLHQQDIDVHVNACCSICKVGLLKILKKLSRSFCQFVM